MEYLRRKNGKTSEFLARIIPCSWGEKSRKRENKNPTPPRNLRGGVGMKKKNLYTISSIDADYYCGRT